MKQIQRVLFLLLLCSAFGVSAAKREGGLTDKNLTLYRSATCQCCLKWSSYMKGYGYNIHDIQSDDLAAIKESRGIPKDLRSCHTAVIGGYTVEGHVPEKEIMALLVKKPKFKGISVPGMPMGSPGMETTGPSDGFDVFSFGGNQGVKPLKHYAPK